MFATTMIKVESNPIYFECFFTQIKMFNNDCHYKFKKFIKYKDQSRMSLLLKDTSHRKSNHECHYMIEKYKI